MRDERADVLWVFRVGGNEGGEVRDEVASYFLITGGLGVSQE
jgi:hypothetical protein